MADTPIPCPQGFFLNDTVTPTTVTDLLSAVSAASENISGAATSATNAAASATAAASSATAAAASQNAAASSATSAFTSGLSASGSANGASDSATTATTKASAAAASAGAASTSATNAATSASAANASATSAANSSTNASTSATNASTSATNASNSAASAATSASSAASAAATASGANTGRNRFHNGGFNVAQRGAGAFTTSGYTADRWRIDVAGGDSFSATVVALTDTDRSRAGDEGLLQGLQVVFTGTNTSSSQTVLSTRLEGVRTLAGKTVTLSLYSRAVSAPGLIGVSYRQSFGTGGSPSADVTGPVVLMNAILTTMDRPAFTFTIPSTSGKTLGTTAGTDFLELNFWFSCGATNANHTLAGSIGQQSNTITLAGLQIEVGSAPTAFEKTQRAAELATCQRFYELMTVTIRDNMPGGGFVGHSFPFKVTKRAVPTVSQVTAGTTVNVSGGLAITTTHTDSVFLQINGAGAGDTSASDFVMAASADL